MKLKPRQRDTHREIGMWVALIWGLVIYKVIKFLFKEDDVGDIPDRCDGNVLFSVAGKLEKLFGGKAFVGLHVPDPDSASRRNIDLVLLTDAQLLVVSVVNEASGFVSVDQNGDWVCADTHRHRRRHHHPSRIPNPVAEATQQVPILQSYLQQRGIDLPESFFSCKVICPNPDFCTLEPNSFPPEVITYDQWVQLKPDSKNTISGWIRGALGAGKKEMQQSLTDQVHFVLSTAPMWDRFEVKGNKHILGEFLEFKGKQDDVQALRNIKRSKVSHVVIQKTSMFGLAPSNLQVLYCPRDYHAEQASTQEWKEVNVRSSIEVLFQQRYSNKVQKYKLSSVISIKLSA